MAETDSTLKECRKCNRKRPTSEFPPNRKCRDGLSSYCLPCHREYNRRWREKRRDYDLSRKKLQSYPEDPELRRERQRREYQNPSVRLKACISSSLRSQLKGGKGGGKTFDILGYTLDELIAHLEVQFQRGMSWDNYGKWHVDHIVPLSSFDVTSRDDPNLKRAWCLTNLRPLWAKENISKGCKRTHLL